MDKIQPVVDKFRLSQKVKLLKFLQTTGVRIVENGDGCYINLDKLTSDEAAVLKYLVGEVDEPINPKHMM